MLKLLLAGLAGGGLLWLGLSMLRSLARPMPGPPPAGEMRKVNIGYRCSICGTELRLVLAADQDPEPPRHCQEDMLLITPIE